MFSIAVFLSVALLSGALDNPADTEANKGVAELQGKWKFTSLMVKGEAVDLADTEPRWVIKGRKVFYGGEEMARVTVDLATRPKIIDLSFRDPKKVYEGIYSVDLDVLKICLSTQTEGVKERPQDFVTKDKENLRLLVFKRHKAEEEDELEGHRGYVGLALRGDKKQNEVVVGDVLAGSPAKKAGLQKDDIVLKIGGERPTGLGSAIAMVRGTKPRTKLTFHIGRAGKETDIVVQVGIMPFALLVGLD